MLHPLFRRLRSMANFHLVRLIFVELIGTVDRLFDAMPWNFLLKELVVP